MTQAAEIDWDDFAKVDMRVGRIVAVGGLTAAAAPRREQVMD